MTVTVASFRQNFPEFGSIVKYPTSQISFWLTIAEKLTSPLRWGNLLDLGQQLFVAHMTVLEYQNQQASSSGGVPGQAVGIVNSKSVDKVSVGFDVNAGIVPDAGHWNLTNYGTRFIYLVNMIGQGPIQVGIGYAPLGSSGGAYPGPWIYNYPNPSQ